MGKEANWFKPGQSGNPNGRPRGASGRSAALGVLDHMLAKAGNLKKLGEAFQREFDKRPVGFFKEIVMPLIPKHHVLAEEGERKTRVAILMDVDSSKEQREQAAKEYEQEQGVSRD